MVGVDLPVEPLRRQIAVTEPVPDLPPSLPMTIDFASSLYFHREGPGLLLGMSDPDEEPGFHLDHPDRWIPRLAEAMGTAPPRCSTSACTGGWAGLYEVTPDHNALIGEAHFDVPLPVRDRLLRPRFPPGAGRRRGRPRPVPRPRTLRGHRPLSAGRFARDGATRPESHIV